MLSAETIKAYNATRVTPDKSVLCHAPFTNLNFEQNGNVTACCYNRSHVLGSYPADNLLDIWFGKKADELREYIKNDDLGGGCALCAYQLSSGNFHNSRAKGYDYVADSKIVQYLKKTHSFVTKGKFMQMPTCMEFELSNTCNLECVMCNGYFSSSIRKNREHKAPMLNPYDDAFVEQLKPFIPHLFDVRFLGGEPFLIDVYYKIWDALIEQNSTARVHITTNATIMNQRVKNLLEKLTCHIVISMDSIVKETYEEIRINAKFDRVWENFTYFYDYTRRKGTRMNFAVCPITLNWREMPDIVRFCNEKDIVLIFNTVTTPQAYSLEYLSAGQLKEVVEFYESVELPNKTYREQYSYRMFTDMAKQVRAWYVIAQQAEDRKEALETMAKTYISNAVAENTIPVEDRLPLVLAILHEHLVHLNGYPYGEDEKGREAHHVANTKLFTRLGTLAAQHNANEFLIALFTSYKYLPLVHPTLGQLAGHFEKLDDLIAASHTIANAELIVKDTLQAEPTQALHHMATHTADELVGNMIKQYA